MRHNMRAIHFFDDEFLEEVWVRRHEEELCRVASDYHRMKLYQENLPKGDIVIATTQMCFLSTRWFEEGFRIFVHDHTGTFEIVLGGGNERTDREIRLGHSLFNLWRGGEFGLREVRE